MHRTCDVPRLTQYTLTDHASNDNGNTEDETEYPQQLVVRSVLTHWHTPPVLELGFSISKFLPPRHHVLELHSRLLDRCDLSRRWSNVSILHRHRGCDQ